MVDEIGKNIKRDTASWIIPDFTTTTHLDRTVCGIALMGAMENYFSMKFSYDCGLSKVILDGTLNDWILLRDKSKKLYDFKIKDLTDWANLLIPVLDKFIDSYKGNVDNDFWQRICTFKRYGSGGQQAFRGWFLVFSPFNDDNKYILNSYDEVMETHNYGYVKETDIVDCSIDVEIIVEDHIGEQYEKSLPYNPVVAQYGCKHTIVFYAGLLMSKYDQEENILSPEPGWLMIRKKEIKYEDMLSYHNNQLKRWSSNISEEESRIIEEILKFSFYISKEFLFPNKKLLHLINFNLLYYFRNFKKCDILDIDKLKHYLLEMSKAKDEYRDLAKFVVTSRIDEIVKSYAL